MENGKIPLFPVWQGIHTGNRSKATCKYICCAARMEEGPKVTLDIQCLRQGGRAALTSTIN